MLADTVVENEELPLLEALSDKYPDREMLIQVEALRVPLTVDDKLGVVDEVVLLDLVNDTLDVELNDDVADDDALLQGDILGVYVIVAQEETLRVLLEL